MKKIAKLSVAILCLSAITGMAHAAKPGAYVGAGLGASSTEHSKHTTSNHDNGLAGRLFTGYNINEFIGIEAGLAKYAQSTSKYNLTAAQLNLPNITSVNTTLRNNLTVFDVVGKAYLPIQNSGFNLYGLAGLAYVHDSAEAKGVAIASNGNVGYSKFSATQNSVHPIYGVGASYDIPNSNFVTNLELTRLQGSANLFGNKKAPNANMLTFNIAYNFD